VKKGDSSLALGMTLSIGENKEEDGRVALGNSTILFFQNL
jgi:hypothetical protein